MESKGLLARLQEITERRDVDDAHDDYDPRDQEACPPPPPRADLSDVQTKAAGTPKKPPVGDRVHTSVYMPRDVWRRLREIAAAEDCKVHDLVMEGIVEIIERRRAGERLK
jgi:hypothetical protein